MLNPFPDLLTYGFFAPTLLRLAAACIIFYILLWHMRKRHDIAALRFPIIGGGMWIVFISVIVEMCAAAGLLAGLYTQYAALIGLLIAFKQYVWRNRYPLFFILPRTTSALLILILCSLILSGAGALAFDIPL